MRSPRYFCWLPGSTLSSTCLAGPQIAESSCRYVALPRTSRHCGKSPHDLASSRRCMEARAAGSYPYRESDRTTTSTLTDLPHRTMISSRRRPNQLIPRGTSGAAKTTPLLHPRLTVISRTYRGCVSLRHVLISPVISGRARNKCAATITTRNSIIPRLIRAPVVRNWR